MPIGAIMGAAGGLMNLLSPLFNRSQLPQQINPLTDQRLQDLLAQLGQAQGQYNTLGGEATTSRDSQNRVASTIGKTSNDVRNLTQPSPNAWFEQYLGNVPEYQQVAKQVSEMSMSQYGRDLAEQTNRQMEQALRAAGDATAGQGFSGAAAQAAGQAAGNVLGQAGLQRSQMAADIFNKTFNNQAGQGQQLAFNDQQMQFQNALEKLTTALQGYTRQGSLLGQAGGQALGQQSNLGAIINALQGNVQDITQPVYATPQTSNAFSGAGDALASMGQYIEGGRWQDMLAKMLGANSGGAVPVNTAIENGMSGLR